MPRPSPRLAVLRRALPYVLPLPLFPLMAARSLGRFDVFVVDFFGWMTAVGSGTGKFFGGFGRDDGTGTGYLSEPLDERSSWVDGWTPAWELGPGFPPDPIVFGIGWMLLGTVYLGVALALCLRRELAIRRQQRVPASEDGDGQA